MMNKIHNFVSLFNFRRLSKPIGILLALLVCLVALFWVLQEVDRESLSRSWSAALDDPFLVFLVAIAFASAFFLRAFAWKTIIPRLSFGQSLAAIHLSLGANHVLPLRLGEPLRVVSVVRRARIPIETATASTITLRSADIVTVVCLGCLAAPGAFIEVVGYWGFAALALALALCTFGFLWMRKLQKINPLAMDLPGPLVFFLTAFAWFAEAAVIWQCARWSGIELTPSEALFVTAVAVASQIVAIAPSGFGTYEAASVAAYAILGHDPGVALAAALITHALKTAYSLLSGGIFTFFPKPGALGHFRLMKHLGPNEISANEVLPQSPVLFFMPALNEEETVESCIKRCPESVSGRSVEILVIDDGSTDRTAQRAKEAGAKVISLPVCGGLGAAVRIGLEYGVEIGAAAIAFCDADEEYPPDELENLIEPILSNGADYVVGSRFLGTIKHMRPHRRFGNKVLTLVLSVIARRRITDGQSGYRAFSYEAAANTEIIHDFNYAQVLTLDLLAKGYRYLEVPISYKFRTKGDSFVKLGGYLRKVVPAVYRELNTT
ncbi:MAG: lysylphosphatidylglycerol synthase domain-containing protein [Acidimicrobiales bacterium]|jgi:uncharacterized membrane protein YbhN (UPF0104 family)|nr:lysylphosphatidylglycerol synthase domain-containing protein [Acidimicrobiales bacterium]MDP6285313.1 lysylphosphatidylglycerol synthase domain-containing protein [Acidimicrobiales bacterium]HJO40497.1 lysylphosphatidylglycerol synthase domain-containing protein [Acidimicrobiales bacterium]|tara:strand:+ start:2189 stop:3841 length:1653 start_codon:yes stop_codon:yes gene_type:complete